MIELEAWGLESQCAAQAENHPGLELGRVTKQLRGEYAVVSGRGHLSAVVSGKFAHDADGPEGYPTVGDWVMLDLSEDTAVIHSVLPRKSAFGRRAAGGASRAQLVAANVDTLFVCMGLDSDYNLRRLERYLAIAWDSGSVPVVVLTKADACEGVPALREKAAAVSLGADVIVCSSMATDGYAQVLPYIRAGRTIAFIGSSGVGKSTLINRLLGEEALATNATRSDGKGRHTTTGREMLLLPGGGIVIDTPGMRELGAMSADLDTAFSDISELAALCRFGDCTHSGEPGCAVLAALESGELDAARLENYKKLMIETSYSGLSSRELEHAKITRMFGGKSGMKEAMRHAKQKKERR